MLRRCRKPGGWGIALALLLSPASGWAAPPIGSFEISFGGNLSIWFGTGAENAAFCEAFAEGIDELEYSDFEIFVDGRGKLFGYLDLAARDAGIRLAMHGPLKGSQRGDASSGITRTTLALKLSGEASDGTSTLGVKGSLRYTGQVAPGGVANGVWDQRFCVQGAGCESYQTVVPTEILPNGGWTLGLEIGDAGGGALNGIARAEFSDGSECSYAIAGKYSAKTDSSRLTLSPITPDCAGTSIQLGVANSNGLVFGNRVALKFKLFGFTGDVVVISFARNPLFAPAGSQNGGAPSNQELYAFICAGTLAITASTDPGACAWSIFGSGQPQSSAALTEGSYASATLTTLPAYPVLEMRPPD